MSKAGRRPLITGMRLQCLKRDWHMPLSLLCELYSVNKDTIIDTGIRHGFPVRRNQRLKQAQIDAEEAASLTYRCEDCLALYQGDCCPNGHRRLTARSA